jgi:hypothetical protein
MGEREEFDGANWGSDPNLPVHTRHGDSGFPRARLRTATACKRRKISHGEGQTRGGFLHRWGLHPTLEQATNHTDVVSHGRGWAKCRQPISP